MTPTNEPYPSSLSHFHSCLLGQKFIPSPFLLKEYYLILPTLTYLPPSLLYTCPLSCTCYFRTDLIIEVACSPPTLLLNYFDAPPSKSTKTALLSPVCPSTPTNFDSLYITFLPTQPTSRDPAATQTPPLHQFFVVLFYIKSVPSIAVLHPRTWL